MGREWAWNGWALDPLPSACARSGVARFISVCSVVLLHCDDPAGLCQARLIFIKELSCQKQSNMAAWLLRVQASLWYWWEHSYLEQNRLSFYLFILEDFWPGCLVILSLFFSYICSVKYVCIIIVDPYNRDAVSSKAQLDYGRKSNIMTLNYPQTQQPHETGFFKHSKPRLCRKGFRWSTARLCTCVHT